jgi:hypothetical protein
VRDGGAEGGESAEVEEVLARLAGPDKWGRELFIARAIAERVELLLEPGER